MFDKTVFRFSNPAYYSVIVSGSMDDYTRDQIRNYFMGEPEFRTDETFCSVSGIFKDQAALSGLLNELYNQHFTILSVQRLEDEMIREIETTK